MSLIFIIVAAVVLAVLVLELFPVALAAVIGAIVYPFTLLETAIARRGNKTPAPVEPVWQPKPPMTEEQALAAQAAFRRRLNAKTMAARGTSAS